MADDNAFRVGIVEDKWVTIWVVLFKGSGTLKAGEHLNGGSSWSKGTEPRQHRGYPGNWKGKTDTTEQWEICSVI